MTTNANVQHKAVWRKPNLPEPSRDPRQAAPLPAKDGERPAEIFVCKYTQRGTTGTIT
jgi:hypothetical protein